MTVGRGQALVLAEGIFQRYSPLPMAMNTSAQGSAAAGANAITAAALTTTVANTILVAVIVTDNRVTPGPTYATLASVTDDKGLTWTLRKQQLAHITIGGLQSYDVEIWWAAAPVAQAYTVTGHLSTVDPNNGGAIHVFAVKGVASSTAPWNPNNAAVNIGQNGSTPAAPTTGAAQTTTDANTFGFAVAYGDLGSTASGTPYGVGLINGATATIIQTTQVSLTVKDRVATEYHVSTTKFTNQAATFTSASFDYVIVADALAG